MLSLRSIDARYGVSPVSVECPLRECQQRLDLVQPSLEECYDGLPQRQPGPAVDHVGRQHGQPSDERRALAEQQDLVLQMPFDQPGGPRRIAGGQRVSNGVVGQPVPLVPLCGRAVQLRNLVRVLPEEASSQQIGEQMVIAPPAALLVEGKQEQVRPLGRLQQFLAVACVP